ncbi:MAG: hypothetical protein GY854_14975 [Deltaproteobacteria bacterium]|nr:hypothetical protein [Deltaproteobacteria bacterium]
MKPSNHEIKTTKTEGNQAENLTYVFAIDDKQIDGSEEYLSAALYYLYCKENGHELSEYANNCFDGRGKKVSPEKIVEVETM